MLLPMEHYPLLANIHALLTPGTYLEIGVQHGQSMNLACRTTKCFGVDPSPDIRFPLNPDAEIFQCTSDRFFQEKADTIRFFSRMTQYFIDIKQKSIDNVTMDYLSMGMSADFADAIRAGANLVRVGSALFGPRIYR